MNKKVLLIMIIVFAIIVIAMSMISLSNNDYLFLGDVWWDTPEEALQQEADKTTETQRTLTIKNLLNKQEISDITVMTFVSENDTLTTVTFITNEDGLYSVYGYTEEMFLDSPTEFVATGDKDQFILFPYNQYHGTIYGWCYSTVSPVINGLTPSVEIFEFECQGKKWALNYWWINDLPESTDVEIDFNFN